MSGRCDTWLLRVSKHVALLLGIGWGLKTYRLHEDGNPVAFARQHVASDRSVLSSTVEPLDREVIITRGVADLDEEKLITMSHVWARLFDKGVITGVAPLMYHISEDGFLTAYPNEDFVAKYIAPITDRKGNKLKVIPHIFCDDTCCDACNLPFNLEKAMARKDAFFEEVATAARMYGYDGYALDFEGEWGYLPEHNVTEFFNELSTYMKTRVTAPTGKEMEMHVWQSWGINHTNLSYKFDSAIDMDSYYYYGFARQRNKGNTQHKRVMPPLVRGEHPAVQARTTGITLKSHLTEFCSSVKPGTCAFGLITYEFANADINCLSMVRLVDWAIEAKVKAIWLWSGGIVTNEWEVALAKFVGGIRISNETVDFGTTDVQTTGFQAECDAWSARPEPETWVDILGNANCSFDSEHTCWGAPLHPHLTRSTFIPPNNDTAVMPGAVTWPADT